MAALPLLAIKGDAAKAVGALKLKDFAACATAFNKALAHHFQADEGNVEAAENGAAS